MADKEVLGKYTFENGDEITLVRSGKKYIVTADDYVEQFDTRSEATSGYVYMIVALGGAVGGQSSPPPRTDKPR